MRASSALMIGALSLVACKSVNDACTDSDDFRCADATHELACRNGRVIAAPCAGPAGCVNHGFNHRCDVSGNHEGDACGTGWRWTGLGHAACAPDKKSQIMCLAGTYARIPCRGSSACETGTEYWPGDHTGDHCDTSVAQEGDACDGEDGLVCTVDRAAILKCVHGRLTIDTRCAPRSCSVSLDRQPGKMVATYSCR